MNNYLFKNMKNKILICISFLFLYISIFGSPIFCKKCKNKGYFYTYEMCNVCGGTGKVTSFLHSKRGGVSKRVGRCSNCSKLGCGQKIGYIMVKKSCNCSNGKSSRKNKCNKRHIDEKLKTFYKR